MSNNPTRSPEDQALTGFDARYDGYRAMFAHEMKRAPTQRERDAISQMDGACPDPEHVHAAREMLDWLENWIRQKKTQEAWKKTRLGRMQRRLRVCYRRICGRKLPSGSGQGSDA